MNNHSTPPVDESWVAHLRDLGSGVAAPTPADPQAMSGVAIRRTRTRRAALVTGGGMMTVAAVAGAAFALGGPTAADVLLPGGSTAESSTVTQERWAQELQVAAQDDPESEGPPDGWEEQELVDLTYALPPGIVTSGPVQDEPGVTSHMWHSTEDPDAPPFLRIAHYDAGSDNPAWPSAADQPGGQDPALPGVANAVRFDVTAEAAGLPDGEDGVSDPGGAGRASTSTMLVLRPSTGSDAYLITLNLPTEPADEFLHAFESTLHLP